MDLAVIEPIWVLKVQDDSFNFISKISQALTYQLDYMSSLIHFIVEQAQACSWATRLTYSFLTYSKHHN